MPAHESPSLMAALGMAISVLLIAGATTAAERQPSATAERGPAMAKTAVSTESEEPQATSTPTVSPTPVPLRGSTEAENPSPSTSPEEVPQVPAPSPLPDLTTDAPTDPAGPPATPAAERVVVQTDLRPFATVGGIDVLHPAMWVERIGLHQSNHEGARDLGIYDTAAAAIVMESRGRMSGLQSAADIVVDPATPIVAPVSGVVARGGSYTLYCDFVDEFVVIVPDGQPQWEVKLLHLVGLQVSAGQRVEAGVTLLAAGAHTLPFASQVDEFTAEPSWPHTHLEVVDTTIPNQPNGGSGSGDCN